MGRHHIKYTGKPLTRQEIIDMRRDALAKHRKKCNKGKCKCGLDMMELPEIPNE